MQNINPDDHAELKHKFHTVSTQLTEVTNIVESQLDQQQLLRNQVAQQQQVIENLMRQLDAANQTIQIQQPLSTASLPRTYGQGRGLTGRAGGSSIPNLPAPSSSNPIPHLPPPPSHISRNITTAPAPATATATNPTSAFPQRGSFSAMSTMSSSLDRTTSTSITSPHFHSESDKDKFTSNTPTPPPESSQKQDIAADADVLGGIGYGPFSQEFIDNGKNKVKIIEWIALSFFFTMAITINQGGAGPLNP